MLVNQPTDLLPTTGEVESHIAKSVAGGGVDVGHESPKDSSEGVAVGSGTDVINGWGPQTQVLGVTFLGRMRVESIMGRGGIWTHSLEVLDDQKGCIRYSYFLGVRDRLPQNIGWTDALNSLGCRQLKPQEDRDRP